MTLHDVDTDASYSSGMDDLTITGEISKVDDERRQVFGWASVTEINGEPVVDLQNDYVDTYEIEKAAYDYVLNSRVGGEMHRRVKKDAPRQVSTLIESMVLTPEKIEKMGLPPETPRGWWIGFQIPKDESGDEVWKAVKDRKYTGFSIHGLGKRVEKNLDEVGKAVMQRTEEEVMGWITRMAETAGVKPEELAKDLVTYLDENQIGDPTDDDLHDFMTTTYGSGDTTVKPREPDVKKFLLAKAAERSTTMTEFMANVDEIAKAFEGVDDESAAYFDSIHKHLIGSHKQEDHDPTKGKSSKDFDKEAASFKSPWDFPDASTPEGKSWYDERREAKENDGPGMKHSRSEHTAGGRAADAAQIAGATGLAALAATPGGRALARTLGRRAGQAGGQAAGAARQGAGAVGRQVGGYAGDVKRDWKAVMPGPGFDSTGTLRFMGTRPNLSGVAMGAGALGAGGVVAGGLHANAARRRKKYPEKFGKRQREVLEKYLGPLEDVSKKIEERDGKFVVLSESGKVLGEHETREKAQRQLAAVEANKDH